MNDRTIPPAERIPSLAAKLAQVMGIVDSIPKNGYNDFHRYKYATEADVSAAVRKELASRNVAVLTSTAIREVRPATTAKGKPTFLTDVDVTITFVDGDSDQTYTITGCGTGDDPSDKGTYKGITGGIKYALMKTFLIPTGDDPEAVAQHQAQSQGFAQAPAGASPSPAGGRASGETGAVPPPGDVYVWKGGKWDGHPITDIDDSYLKWWAGQCDVTDEKWGKANAKKLAVVQAEQQRRANAKARGGAAIPNLQAAFDATEVV